MLEVRHRVVPGGRRIFSGESGVLQAVARDETKPQRALEGQALSKVTYITDGPTGEGDVRH